MTTATVTVTVNGVSDSLADAWTWVSGDWNVEVAAVEADDGADFSAQFATPIDVDLAAAEQGDTASIQADVVLMAELASIEDDDAAAFTAHFIAPLSATIAAAEDDDAAAFAATFPIHATLATTEQDDAAAAVIDHGWEAIVAQQRAQVVYRCVMEAEGLEPIVLPINSWQATLQVDRANFLQCVVPGATTEVIDAINARAAGSFRIDRGAKFPSGTTNFIEMARAPEPTIRIDTGSRRRTVTLSGTLSDTGDAATGTRDLEDVQTVSISGGLRIRAGVDWRLRPGMTARFDGGEFTVSFINYIVGTRREFMDVGERAL